MGAFALCVGGLVTCMTMLVLVTLTWHDDFLIFKFIFNQI